MLTMKDLYYQLKISIPFEDEILASLLFSELAGPFQQDECWQKLLMRDFLFRLFTSWFIIKEWRVANFPRRKTSYLTLIVISRKFHVNSFKMIQKKEYHAFFCSSWFHILPFTAESNLETVKLATIYIGKICIKRFYTWFMTSSFLIWVLSFTYKIGNWEAK